MLQKSRFFLPPSAANRLWKIIGTTVVACILQFLYFLTMFLRVRYGRKNSNKNTTEIFFRNARDVRSIWKTRNRPPYGRRIFTFFWQNDKANFLTRSGRIAFFLKHKGLLKFMKKLQACAFKDGRTFGYAQKILISQFTTTFILMAKSWCFVCFTGNKWDFWVIWWTMFRRYYDLCSISKPKLIFAVLENSSYEFFFTTSQK